MIPKIKRILKPEKGYCKMCGAFGLDFYKYIAPLSKVQLNVCKKCAIREHYGSTQSKKYQKDKKKNRFFGEEIHSN